MKYLRWILARKFIRAKTTDEIPVGVLQTLVVEMLKEIARKIEKPVVEVIEDLLDAAKAAQEELEKEVFGDD